MNYSGGQARGVLVAVAAGCLVAALTGCGRSTYSVNGQVVWKHDRSAAKELKGYEITLEGKDAEGKPVSGRGTVDEEGKFQIGTYGINDGATLGDHRVAITPPILASGSTARSKILPKYADFAKSALTITVKSGTNEPVLEVERQK
jgi:hypothetical protein